MATVEDKCFFSNLYSCSEEKTSLSQTSIVRVIQASKQYEDGLHLELQKQQKLGILSIFVHRKFIDKYCYKKTIQRAIQEKFRKRDEGDLLSKPKQVRRSENQKFSFLHLCIVCGEQCNTVKDSKHPKRNKTNQNILHMFAGKVKYLETVA